jgi:hypothetical protein
MPRKRRTAEEVCIAYAVAVERVRFHTRIMHNHPCTEGRRKNFNETGETECLDQHFAIEVYDGGHGNPKERPSLAEEDMCDNCRTRLQALNERKDARKRLGAAKRSVEAVGKRLESPDA